MDTEELMIEMSNNKTQAVDLNDNGKIEAINTKLYNLKRQEIQRAKVYMTDDNTYKKYLTENLEYIKSRVGLNITVKTTEEAIRLLQEVVDMRVMFGIDSQYAEIFESEVFLQEEYFEGIEATREEAECELSKVINTKDGFINIDYCIEENVALGMWIYRASLYTAKLKSYMASDRRTKKQLYFLKSNKELNDNSYSIYFDIVEIYEICLKCNNHYSAIKELCKLVNIQIEYEINQENKYENNLKLLKETSLLKEKYPVLYDCLKYHFKLLETINIEGQGYVNYSYKSYKGENIFAFSNKIIGLKAVNAESIENKSKSVKGTVNPKITLYCLLGLLQKIPFENLPKKYRFKAIGYNNEENSYIIPLYTEEILIEAENRVRKLKEAKIKPTKINSEKCRLIFGEEIYRNIFGNYYKIGA